MNPLLMTSLGSHVIGFTGTQGGMTPKQREAVRYWVSLSTQCWHSVVGLHGDCIGADAEFNAILASYDLPRFSRPCFIKRKRAFTDAKPLAEPEEPLARNEKIVFDAEEMIAAPKGFEEERRSGTWATIRRARKQHKPLTIVYPDGNMRYENMPHHEASRLTQAQRLVVERTKT
jgi:hypothetical protein